MLNTVIPENPIRNGFAMRENQSIIDAMLAILHLVCTENFIGPRVSAGPVRDDESPGRRVGNALSRLLLRPLYRLYEIRIHRQVRAQPAPRHVA